MTRPLLIAGNWKMNKTVSETTAFIDSLERKLPGNLPLTVVLFPPFVALSSAARHIDRIQLGAQNMYHESSGAFTGEVSPVMLQGLCRHVLLGHSERRHIFHEEDAQINRKLRAALEFDLQPVLCIGETKEQRDGGHTFEILENQLTRDLEGLSVAQIQKVVVAYEPVWAIGTGDTATPRQAQEVHRFIRTLLENRKIDSQRFRILYGGSVKSANCRDLLCQPDIDGALIGGASLHVDGFFDIIQKSITVEKLGG